MSFRLIVTEKPSVARDLARVLGVPGRGKGVLGGNGPVRITWCLGHLTELAEPATYDPAWRSWRLDDLPMLPTSFELQPRKSSLDQWRVVRDLLRDRGLGEVVNACDAGREGELIFANTYRLAGCRAPVQRLWISAMTASAIRAGMASLRPGRDLAPLEDAARSRSEADWLVGLNATRAMTLRLRDGTGGTLLSLGRVQTPTLALIGAREDELEAFVPQDFWRVVARFRVEHGDFEATWFGSPDQTGTPDQPVARQGRGEEGSAEERIWEQPRAQAILERISGRDGVVEQVEAKEKRERPPLLYDLTALQREANKRFTWSAKHTLTLAQSLYEQRKVLTYPRTDSRHLSSDQVPGLQGLLESLRFGPYGAAAQAVLQRWPFPPGKRVVDDAEVSDHHAIIPTGVDPRTAGLTNDEKRLFDLVARRFLAALHPDAVFATQLVVVAIDDDRFRARGRALLEPGWRAIDPPRSKRKEKGLLPKVTHSEVAHQEHAELREGTTRPPRRYTEGTLLGAMERAGETLDEAAFKRAMKKRGLGTPATRAAIIETLLRRDYIARQDAELVPTPQGRALLAVLPVEALRSARLTGAWEARLASMAEGGEEREAFMADIRAFATEVVQAILDASLAEDQARVLRTTETPEGPRLGDCPLCQAEVRAGRRGWSCVGCDLRIPSRVASRDLSERMAKTLLKKRTTKAVKGFKNKQGKAFSAALILGDDGKVGFHFPDPDPLGPCPACGTPVRRRGKVWTCDTGRACSFVVFAEMSGCAPDDAAVEALLADGQGPLVDFRDRSGATWSGRLRWSGERVVPVRVDRRQEAGAVARCPRDRGAVRFVDGRWRCETCAFRLPAVVASRPLQEEDVAALCRDGATMRLYGFRQREGERVLKAAMVLDGQEVRLDWGKGRPDWCDQPVPRGSPPPAFGPKRTVCPRCLDAAEPRPGWVVRGRTAWGCSRWRAGCAFRLPFDVLGEQLTPDEAQRLLGKHRATRYRKHTLDGEQVRGRLVLDPEGEPVWGFEPYG